MRRIVLFVFAIAAAGCQRSEYSFTEVEGTVTRAGRPQPGVVVCFWPDIEAGTQAPRATAVTDATGHYRLRCDEGTNGAVVGRYRVCLSLLNMGGKAMSHAEPLPPDVKKALSASPDSALMNKPAPPPSPGAPIPERYTRFRDTPLRDIEIVAGSPQTFDFQITMTK